MFKFVADILLISAKQKNVKHFFYFKLSNSSTPLPDIKFKVTDAKHKHPGSGNPPLDVNPLISSPKTQG